MRVLCIDDEPDILELMADFLELLGFDVVTAADSRQGLEIFLADSGGFDVVITDMKMPHMSGLDLLKELRTRGHNVPVIMASGQHDEDLNQMAGEYDVAAIIAKPFTLSEFKELLDGVGGIDIGNE